jgi:galactose oxidase
LYTDGTSAVRPVITSADTSVGYGGTLNAATDSTVNAFALVRLSAATHSLNNDQRRVPLQSNSGDGRSHILKMPADPGIAPPGYYMLFALNPSGVPSVAKTIRLN